MKRTTGLLLLTFLPSFCALFAADESPERLYTKLHMAAANGNFETIKAAVLAAPDEINTPVSPNVYYRMMNGETALQIALHRRGSQTSEIVEFLVEHGADVNAREVTGETPLVLAQGDPGLTDYLLSKGARFDIFTAVILDRLDQIALRLKENCENANATLETGETPLFRARSLAATELLLSHGANVNHRNRRDCTPLWNARDRATAELFLAYGADIHTRSQYMGCTALYAAAMGGRSEVLELLIEQGADPNAAVFSRGSVLHNVSDERVLELLLRHGVDVNVRGQQGETALFGADERTLQFLISKGADVHAQCNSGRTALHGFAQITAVSQARVLLANGARVDAVDKAGFTPLHLAYHKVFAELLFTHGANVNARDASGRTPLHQKKNVDAIEFLVSKGADINTRDKEGQTPLSTLKYLEDVAATIRKLGGKE